MDIFVDIQCCRAWNLVFFFCPARNVGIFASIAAKGPKLIGDIVADIFLTIGAPDKSAYRGFFLYHSENPSGVFR
jgi:hypothetical protein